MSLHAYTNHKCGRDTLQTCKYASMLTKAYMVNKLTGLQLAIQCLFIIGLHANVTYESQSSHNGLHNVGHTLQCLHKLTGLHRS